MYLNQQRARQFMREYELDVLVATSPVNITYFSGYFCWLDSTIKGYMVSPGVSEELVLPGYAVFPMEGQPALVLNPLFAINAADLWVQDIRIFGKSNVDSSFTSEDLPDNYLRFSDMLLSPPQSETALDALLGILRDRGLLEGRIGLEINGLYPQKISEIKKALPQASLMDCSNLILLVRMVKNDYELEQLTRSAEINEQAGMEALAQVKPGISLADVSLIYRNRAASFGADFDHFCIGLNGLGMATEPVYKFTAEDVMMVDFGCIYNGCYSDTGTTLAINENLPRFLNERFKAIRDCISAGVELICPRVKCSTIYKGMRKILSEQGFGASFPRGHGLGLEIRDYPTIGVDNGLRIHDDCVNVPSDLPLEEKMVINLEVPMFLPGVASFQIEQSWVVTQSGRRPLVRQKREQPYTPT